MKFERTFKISGADTPYKLYRIDKRDSDLSRLVVTNYQLLKHGELKEVQVGKAIYIRRDKETSAAMVDLIRALESDIKAQFYREK